MFLFQQDLWMTMEKYKSKDMKETKLMAKDKSFGLVEQLCSIWQKIKSFMMREIEQETLARVGKRVYDKEHRE